MRLDLSVLSQNEIDTIRYRTVTFDQALRYMSEDLHVRSFAEALAPFYDGDDVRQRLTDGLYQIELSIEGGLSRESVARNVRNWMGGQNAPDRENLIKICFALGFGETKAKAFLPLSSDGGFHLRNPLDLALAFGLRAGKTYGEAMRLYKRLKPLDPEARPDAAPVFTKTVADLFDGVADDESFLRFYTENYDALGVMRNTAYYKCFLPFMNTLICPDVPRYFEKERKYSIGEVVDEYLRMNIPFERGTAKYALTQKTIRKYWPNAASVTRMRARAEDISRKILLLLYLVTGGQSAADAGQGMEAEDLTADEQFENHYWKLNAMLDDCGFSLLDPRSLFDWLVLFCLKADGDLLMSERLQGLLGKIFKTETN